MKVLVGLCVRERIECVRSHPSGEILSSSCYELKNSCCNAGAG